MIWIGYRELVWSLADAVAALNGYLGPAPPPGGGQRPLAGTRALLAALGDPQEAVPAVHVAGTSGKTSTAYLLRALLRAGGLRTGLTVSPHVATITERVQLDAGPVPTDFFAARVEQFLPLVAATGLRPSYFEVLIALAHWVFAGSAGRDRPVDVVVLETGIGGRLDRTNTIRRPDKVCVLTDIGYDHTEMLGDTIEEIAAHKAGIIQPGNQVLVIEQDERVLKVVGETAQDRGASLAVVPVGAPLPGVDLPPFQWRNVSLALAAYRHLADALGATPLGAASLGPRAVAAAVREVPPGRMECVPVGDTTVLLDGAHNPQKLAALVDALRARGLGRVPVLASLLRAPEGKLRAALATLAPVVSTLVVPEFTAVAELGRQTPPATEVAALARAAGIADVVVVPDPLAGLATLLAGPAPVVLVTGSLYLVSQVRQALPGV